MLKGFFFLLSVLGVVARRLCLSALLPQTAGPKNVKLTILNVTGNLREILLNLCRD